MCTNAKKPVESSAILRVPQISAQISRKEWRSSSWSISEKIGHAITNRRWKQQIFSSEHGKNLHWSELNGNENRRKCRIIKMSRNCRNLLSIFEHFLKRFFAAPFTRQNHTKLSQAKRAYQSGFGILRIVIVCITWAQFYEENATIFIFHDFHRRHQRCVYSYHADCVKPSSSSSKTVIIKHSRSCVKNHKQKYKIHIEQRFMVNNRIGFPVAKLPLASRRFSAHWKARRKFLFTSTYSICFLFFSPSLIYFTRSGMLSAFIKGEKKTFDK